MHMYHEEFGWGEVVGHDLDNNVVKVMFSEFPYKEKEIKDFKPTEIKTAHEAFSELAQKYNKNPDDFSLIPAVVYRDRTNEEQYEGFSELVFVPKHIANEVQYVKVTFTMDSVKFFNAKNEVILNSLSTGYSDLGPIEAFIQ